MRIGIFGGSFNPPHKAHVLVASLVLSSDLVDKILVVPCLAHPFSKDLEGFSHRMEMCRLAFGIFGDQVMVSDLEERLSGMSYTIDTLRALTSERPGDEFRLITGSDIVLEFSRWREGSEVERLAPPILLGRGDADVPVPDGWEKIWDHPLPDVSSSEIRKMILRDDDCRRLLPAHVFLYIKENELYGSKNR
jgi:nicotinate-nucleotide adenylyltransferase